MPLRFSIVIPTLNRREMLPHAIDSICVQKWPDVEIIVVDGGSTDGTLETLASHSDINLITGPDRGLYDACNKGISVAGGEVLGLLNSDDLYEPGTFAAVAAAFGKNPQADAVCGGAVLVGATGILATFDDDRDKLLASARTSLIGSCIPNARFFRRDAMRRVGPFSLDYRYIADRDWLTRWHEAHLTTVAIAQRVYRYQQHAGSLTLDHKGRHGTAIYRELMILAQRWQTDTSASSETRHIAALLNGRCVARLVARALRRGKIADAARLLFTRDGKLTLNSANCIIRAVFDLILTSRESRAE